MNYITSKDWWSAAGIRAIKTFCQAALGIITTGVFIQDINWMMVLSASSLAAIVSLLNSLVGLPELPDGVEGKHVKEE